MNSRKAQQPKNETYQTAKDPTQQLLAGYKLTVMRDYGRNETNLELTDKDGETFEVHPRTVSSLLRRGLVTESPLRSTVTPNTDTYLIKLHPDLKWGGDLFGYISNND